MRLLPVLVLLAVLPACEREDRQTRSDPVPRESKEEIALVPLSPGTSPPVERRSGLGKDYEENSYHISNGKRLFSWFNCNGCHANGGGDSGPPLMDDKWIYGGAIENIAQTIREGRPNGMPSFRGKVPDDQIWELAAYVRSMGRHVPKAAAPGRNDDMHPGESEQSRSLAPEIQGGTASPSETQPQ